MLSFKEKYGPWAIVTGASSGIGEEYARQIAARGLNLIIIARRKERLDNLAKELTAKHGIQVKAVPLDLSTDDFMPKLLKQIKGCDVGLLVNNAGIAHTGDFLKNDLQKELDAINLGCKTPFQFIHVFGNMMVKRGRGGIIIMSSVTQYNSNPGTSSYSAVKAFTYNFGGGLWYELKRKGVDVFITIPGLVKTDFFLGTTVTMQHGYVRHIYWPMKADKVVKQALDNLGKKSQYIHGFFNKLLALVLGRLTPRPLSTIIANGILKLWEWESKKYLQKK